MKRQGSSLELKELKEKDEGDSFASVGLHFFFLNLRHSRFCAFSCSTAIRINCSHICASFHERMQQRLTVVAKK